MTVGKQELILDYRIMELTTLNEIAQVVNSTLDLRDVLDEIVRLTTARMRADACAVFLLDNRDLILQATRGLNMDQTGRFRVPLGEGLTGHAGKVGKPFTENNLVESSRFKSHPELGDEAFASMLAVPLIAKGRILGVINIYMRTQRDFGPQEIHFLSSIAGLVSGAIRNSQIYLKAQQTIDELTALKEISNLLGETLDLERILTVTAESSSFVTKSQGAILRLYERGKGSGLPPQVASHQSIEFPRLYQLDERESKASLSAVAQGYPYTESWAHGSNSDKRYHLLCSPIEIQNKVQGTLCVYRGRPSDAPYSSEERRLLGSVMAYASTCIENARLFERVKRAERELREAHQQLFLREKLAALGEMAAGVAHELRNPLVSIGGYSRRIIKHGHDPQKTADYANIITREVERLERLANDILEYVSPREPSFTAVDMKELFCDVFQVERDFLRRETGIRFQRDVSPEALCVWADRKHLETALLDLVQNAVDACQGGGTITVRTSPKKTDPDRVCIIVEDTGIGISEENLQNIFLPFFTTKTSGSGLGLATTKNVIDAHDGTVEVESKQGAGTSFRITLLRPPEERKDVTPDQGEENNEID